MNVQLPVYFTAGAPLQECVGLCAHVEGVSYQPGIDAPVDRPYPFVYTITVCNGTPEPLTIRGRKWVVADRLGHLHVTEGDGVVGRCPRLLPGEHFQYQSYHAVAADSTAEGALLATGDAGRKVIVRIPRFCLTIPGQP